MINFKKFFPLAILIGSCIWDGGETSKGHKESGRGSSVFSNSQDDFYYNDFDKRCLEGLKNNQELRIIPHFPGVNRFKSGNSYTVVNYEGDITDLVRHFSDISKYNVHNVVTIKKNDKNENLEEEMFPSSVRLLKIDENKFLWFLPYPQYRAEVFEKNGYFYPTKFYFQRVDLKLDTINVEYEDVWTKYSYKDSVIYVNHDDATKNPFDLTRSHVNIEEFKDLISNLSCTNVLMIIKYFFDFIALKNGMQVIYEKNDYFNVKLEEDSLLINIDVGNYNEVKTKLENLKKLLEKTDLCCTKLNITYTDPSFARYNMHGIKLRHVMLLFRYNNQFFIIDTNGYMQFYINEEFEKVISELGIRFCKNEIFIQNDGNCDTSASFMSFLLSNYWKDNDNKLPLTNDNDVDFEKIFDHAKPFDKGIMTFFWPHST